MCFENILATSELNILKPLAATETLFELNDYSNFENEEQAVLPLFPADTKKQDILHAVDGIRKKFGNDVIHMGGKER